MFYSVRQAISCYVGLLFMVAFLCSCYPYMPQLIVMSTMDMPSVESADFSPTENIFALRFRCSPVGGIFIVDLQGRVLRWLCKGTGRYYYRSPSFSPDGKRVAFCADEGSSYSSIYIINTDGSNQQRLTQAGKVYDHSPVFSADGTRIYFIRDTKVTYQSNDARNPISLFNNEIFSIDLTSLREVRIATLPMSRLLGLGVLPDNQTLYIFTSRLPDRLPVLIRLNTRRPIELSEINPTLPPLAEGFNKPIYQERYSFDLPSLKSVSRDGRFLLFDWTGRTEDNKAGGRQVYVADMTSMKSTSIGIIGDTSSFALAISPDGNTILINKNPELRWGCGPVLKDSPLYLINRESGSVQNLTLDFTAVWDEIREVQRTTPPRR